MPIIIPSLTLRYNDTFRYKLSFASANSNVKNFLSTTLRGIKNVHPVNSTVHKTTQRGDLPDPIHAQREARKAEYEKQFESLQRLNDKLNVRYKSLVENSANINPGNIRSDVVNARLGYLLLKDAASENCRLYGALYQMIADEEGKIVNSSVNEQQVKDIKNICISRNEEIILQKIFIERRLAIVDYCLRVLRLNKQAEWDIAKPRTLGKKPLSADNMLSKSLEYAAQKPHMGSDRGIDSRSGLYHELQFNKSGTCVLHANNHYLAGWCARDGRPFLPLTPRRLEILLSAVQHRKGTELRELKAMQHQRLNAGEITRRTAISTLSRGEATVLLDKNSVVDYKKIFDSGKIFNSITTGYLISDKITDAINQLYGLPGQIDTPYLPVPVWYNNLADIKTLEKMQDGLICRFYSRKNDISHAICFNKKDGVWYLQDSNFPYPLKCRPCDLIDHILGINAPESSLLVKDKKFSYRQVYALNKDSAVSFHHFEPKQVSYPK